MCAIVKGEIQGVDTCAARAKLAMVISVGAGNVIGGAIPVIVVAGSDMVCVIVLSTDG